MTEVQARVAGLHLKRAPADQGIGQSEVVFAPVAAGAQLRRDPAPALRFLQPRQAQRVIGKRDAQRGIQLASSLTLYAVDGAF